MWAQTTLIFTPASPILSTQQKIVLPCTSTTSIVPCPGIFLVAGMMICALVSLDSLSSMSRSAPAGLPPTLMYLELEPVLAVHIKCHFRISGLRFKLLFRPSPVPHLFYAAISKAIWHLQHLLMSWLLSLASVQDSPLGWDRLRTFHLGPIFGKQGLPVACR